MRTWPSASPQPRHRSTPSSTPCSARRRSSSPTRTSHTSADDRDRYQLEAAVRFAARLDRTVRALVRGSLRDGHEHAIDLAGFRLGIVIRADDGHETYAAIRITGPVPQNLTTVILSRVPGCDPTAWFPEYALPERELLPAEQIWSNLMDPKAAAQLLDEDP